jgi:hypothetical protein
MRKQRNAWDKQGGTEQSVIHPMFQGSPPNWLQVYYSHLES